MKKGQEGRKTGQEGRKTGQDGRKKVQDKEEMARRKAWREMAKTEDDGQIMEINCK